MYSVAIAISCTHNRRQTRNTQYTPTYTICITQIYLHKHTQTYAHKHTECTDTYQNKQNIHEATYGEVCGTIEGKSPL